MSLLATRKDLAKLRARSSCHGWRADTVPDGVSGDGGVCPENSCLGGPVPHGTRLGTFRAALRVLGGSQALTVQGFHCIVGTVHGVKVDSGEGTGDLESVPSCRPQAHRELVGGGGVDRYPGEDSSSVKAPSRPVQAASQLQCHGIHTRDRLCVVLGECSAGGHRRAGGASLKSLSHLTASSWH